MKIKALAFAALAAIMSLFPAPARAIECDQQTNGIGLCLPRYGTDFDQWAMADIAALQLLNSSGTINSTSTVHMATTLITRKLSGMATAPFGIEVSSPIFLDAGNYFMNRGSETIAGGGGLLVNYGADIGSMTVRNQATVVGTATVQGNSFSVGGASFTVAGGSATVAYLLTARNVVATDSVTANSFFGDGSHLTGIAAGGTLVTTTTYPSGSLTQANMGPCVAVGTATLTTPVGRCQITLGGSIRWAANSNYVVDILVDGAFIHGKGGVKGVVAAEAGTAGQQSAPIAHSWMTESLTAAEHKFCLTMASPTGGGTQMTTPVDQTTDSVTQLHLICGLP